MNVSMPFEIEGVRLAVVNTTGRADLLRLVEARLAAGRGFSVATLNVDHLVKLRASADFRQAYAQHTFVVADGNPVVWLSRLARRPIDLVPGCELVEPLARAAVRAGVPIALLGATEECLAAAGDRLAKRAPGLEVAARIAPARGFDPEGPEADACIARLRACGARLAFLALGAPKQEIFAARAQAELPEVGFVSIGAGLDFIAGAQRRAPVWMRRWALEWLWRAASNPQRLAARYARCFHLLPALTAEAMRMRGVPATGEMQRT